MGEFFKKFGEGLRRFPKTQDWREETMGAFFRENWRGFAWISENWRGGNYGRIFLLAGGRYFSRNLERVCLDFQKALLAGGNYGGIFLEIQRRVCVDFQKAMFAGRNYMGVFLEIQRRVCVDFQKAILVGG